MLLFYVSGLVLSVGRGRWRPRVADSASVVVSQAVVAGLCGARGAVGVAGGRAAWLPPPGRKRGQFSKFFAAGDRLRELATHFVAFMRRHASSPPSGAKFGNFPPPLGGKLPSFGSRRPARPFYANSATFIQTLRANVAEFANSVHKQRFWPERSHLVSPPLNLNAIVQRFHSVSAAIRGLGGSGRRLPRSSLVRFPQIVVTSQQIQRPSRSFATATPRR